MTWQRPLPPREVRDRLTHRGWIAIIRDEAVPGPGETPQQVAQAQRELVRIGIDRPAAAATGQPGQWSGGQPLATLRLAKFGNLAAARPENVAVLDVRRALE